MHNTPLPVSVDARSLAFDKKESAKYMKNAGRAYKKQAMELITFCRLFSQAQKPTSCGYDELRR